MKILITTDTVGGVWNYSTDLATCLIEDNIEVVLAAMGPSPNKGQEPEIKSLKKLGVVFYHQTFQLEWMDDPWEDVKRAGVWLRSLAAKEGPDVMHFNNYGQVALGWEIPTVVVAHSCVASWWHSVKKEPLPEKYAHYFDVVNGAFQKADVLVAPSYAQLKVYQNLYGRRNNQKVVYNGISAVPDFNSTKLPILFSMGRLWDEAKNINLILNAAPKINGEIFIAGEGLKKLSGPKNVTFLGELSRNQIFNWLKISCGYVLPVKYEPFGLSFLEAAAHRTALIGGNIPTLQEIWGSSMSYVDPENHYELADSCNALLTQKDRCIIDGDKAYERSRLYTLKRMGEEYQQLYGKMLVNAEISG